MDINELDEQTDMAQFLEKFNQTGQTADFAFSVGDAEETAPLLQTAEPYNQSFEKLEEKIQELEEKFAASTAQNEAVMQELVRTRQAVENQKSKDAFFANIATTIANLKQSVENLSHVRQTGPMYVSPAVPRAFDAPISRPAAAEYLSKAYDHLEQYHAVQQANLQAALEDKEQAVAAWKTEHSEKESLQLNLQAQQAENEQLLSEKTAYTLQLEQSQAAAAERERMVASLHQKTSQLKAVNVALDREIKRVQEERTEALRKSAEQAKEILSLRDALTAAEERFRSFDFKGRIISVKRHYEQKVSKLETQLHEISNTCMKQVEEIESLKTENLKLQQVAEEKEQLAALYEVKNRELESLKASMTQLKVQADPARLADFTRRMQHLQAEHEQLAERLAKAQQILQLVSQEKQTLEQNFKALLVKIEKNDAIIDSLKQKIAVLLEENRELKKGQARPILSARSKEPEAVAVRQPVKPTAPPPPTKKQSLAVQAQTAPVEMQNTLHAQVKTDADLPEIKVADPIPQPEVELGDDFLEKTDSFIGRMKWSIFREDK